MKPFFHASLRWMQQRLCYLAYMENRGEDSPLPPDGQQQQGQSGSAATTEPEPPGLAEAGSAAFHR